MLCINFKRICKYIQHLLLVKGTSPNSRSPGCQNQSCGNYVATERNVYVTKWRLLANEKRAETLFGRNVHVTHTHVFQAKQIVFWFEMLWSIRYNLLYNFSTTSPLPCDKVENEWENWEDWEEGPQLSVAEHQVEPWVGKVKVEFGEKVSEKWSLNGNDYRPHFLHVTTGEPCEISAGGCHSPHALLLIIRIIIIMMRWWEK